MELPPANSLVTAMATGQPGSFAALYDRLGPSLLRVAGVMLRNSGEAEDAVQDVFVEIARRPDRLKQVINLEAYVFAILRNNVTKRIRWKQEELKRLQQLPPKEASERSSSRDDLNQALASLPDDYFAYFLSLLVTYVVAVIIILRMAFSRPLGVARAAATWARAPLFVVFLIANSIAYMTVLDMDLAIRARCAILSVDVNSLYLATLPAITSDDQNAALIYKKVFAKMQESPPTGVKNPPIGDAEKFDPDEPATIAYLALHSSTIALLHKTASLPGCRFDDEIANPAPDRMVSDTNNQRRAAELLRLHAREELAHGQVASAVADAAAIIRLADHCGQRPMLVSALAAYELNAVGAKTLEETLSAVRNKGDLSSLHLQDPARFRRIFQQAWRSEERFFLNNLTVEPATIGISANTYPPTGNGIQQLFFRVFVLNPDGYIHLMEKLQSLSMLPYYQAAPAVENTRTAKSESIFTSILANYLPREFRGCARGEADTACMEVAVAMTRYRLDHGSLPLHLADLLPSYLDSIPIDPFDGHPLRLAIKGEQYIVYSVGGDGIDNGGADLDDNGNGDVTFKLAAKP